MCSGCADAPSLLKRVHHWKVAVLLYLYIRMEIKATKVITKHAGTFIDKTTVGLGLLIINYCIDANN